MCRISWHLAVRLQIATNWMPLIPPFPTVVATHMKGHHYGQSLANATWRTLWRIWLLVSRFTLMQTYIDYYWVYKLLHFNRPPYILHTAPQQRVSPKQDLNGCQSIFDRLIFWHFQGLTWIREEKVDTALTVLWCWRLLSQIKTNVCCATQCSRTTSRTKESDWGSHCWKHLL